MSDDQGTDATPVIVRQIPSFGELYVMLRTLTDVKRARVETYQAQATSYVWGFQDASGAGAKDTGTSTDFGQAYAMHAARFEAEIIGCRHSIPESFKRWTKGEPIERKH